MSWIRHRKKKNHHGLWHNEDMKELRKQCIEFLGSRCSNPNCLVPNGCSDVRCLQIDHINGLEGGKRRNHLEIYLDILKNPESKTKYQLLCANCNWIKRSERKELPHCYERKRITQSKHHLSVPK